MNDLPIFSILPELDRALCDFDQIVLQAEPGAGKSTQVPLHLLKSSVYQNKKIVMLEPRRMAARNLAHYLAKCLNEPVGQTVGYQVRNDRKISKSTRLEIITEGVLTARLQQDPELSGMDIILFDEFHERSLNSDFGLVLCLEVQETLREDLKLVIMSATLDADQLTQFLPNASAIFCEGRSYPIEVHYSKSSLLQTLKQASQATHQDILIFLAGQKEIQQAIEAVSPEFEAFQCLPLYGGLKAQQQDQVLSPSNSQRRLIFSTNIAETSLTIPNIGAVVDSGEIKRLVYDPNSGMSRIVKGRISKASADQRAGRAGRLSAGLCYRMWSEDAQHQLIDFEPAEITQVDLSNCCFQSLLWGNHPLDMDWLTPPPKPHVEAAMGLMRQLNLLDPTDKQLNTNGRKLPLIGSDIRLSYLFSQAQKLNLTSLACELCGLLMEGDIWLRSQDQSVRSRIESLRSYEASRKQATAKFPLNVARTEQALKNRNRLLKQFNVTYDKQGALDAIGLLIGFAYPDRIGQKRPHQSQPDQIALQLSNGRGAQLYDLGNINHEYFAIYDLDGQNQNGRVYLYEPIQIAQLKENFALTKQSRFSLVGAQQKVHALEEIKLGALSLESKKMALNSIDQNEISAFLLQAIRGSHELNCLSWKQETIQLMDRINWASQFDERFPKMTKASLAETLEGWCLPYLAGKTSISELKALNLSAMLLQTLDYELQNELERNYPRFYISPTGKKFPIHYANNQARTSLKLQEVFGEEASPEIGCNKVKLTFELLSPANRPIQITSDLAFFWDNSYHDVAKEMRGRYPKHRWPEDPLVAEAGHSIKKRT